MLHSVISELIDEKGLKQSDLNLIIQEGILAAYNKKYPESIFKVEIGKSDTINVQIEREVSSDVEDEVNQISLRKARFIDKEVQVGDKIWTDFDGVIGRVEILKAKQVIAHKIKEIEAQGVYDEFIDRQGSIVQGTVHKCEQSGVTVMLRDTLAFLPRSYSVPTERYAPGRPIRALLKEVRAEYHSNGQLILDRASSEFLVKLLELEIPEIYDKLIEIKAASRKAGYKSKIIVASHDSNIDPVGTCVGVGGGRIKPILKELGGEKIDVISWVNSREELVKNALRPAEVNRVEINRDGNKATVWLSEDQRAFAIGKMGQNISLAAELIHMEIELISSSANSGEGIDFGDYNKESE